jgi:lauroyl/myristoyl acyltransferase
MPNASKIIHLAGYALYLASTAVARIFPLSAVFLAGKMLGGLGFIILPGRRRLAVGNLKLALNLDEKAANMLSALKIATMSDGEIRERVTIEIPPELEKAAQGEFKKGWVVMISHMGNWELFSHLAPFFPHFKFGAVYHRLANDYVDRHFKETRARSGVTLFDRREGYLKCVSFIREGGAVGVLVDQYAGLPGTWMPFFRRLTSTSTLAATLALRADTRIVPIAIRTTGLARWHIVVSLPVEQSADAEIFTARINSELEKQISAAPADWLWSHNRWKTPQWMFLFSKGGRRVFYPPDFDRSTLIPYRVIIRSPDEMNEAEASLRAVKAVRRGRPDMHLTLVAPEAQTTFWKGTAEVDELITFSQNESAGDVAAKIKSAGRFDAGILFSPARRAAIELWRGGVPYRVGSPNRFILNDWENPPGFGDPPLHGAERYRRIAEAVGAVLDDSPRAG